jgi:phosphocarrier protein
MVKEVVIKNKFGLHSRPATLLVATAQKFKADIQLRKDETAVDAKSILEVMSIACAQGTSLAIKAQGVDEVEALDSLTDLINNRFGEE